MLIGLVGPHAIGKTTAMQRWVAKYPKLVGVCCDTGTVIQGDAKEQTKGWYKPDAVGVLVEHYRKLNNVVVLEGCAQRWHCVAKQFEPTEPIIHVFCDWQIAKKLMVDRCNKIGKKFNYDYWTEKWLRYEASKRFTNFATKNLSASQVVNLMVNDVTTDWPIVDKHFWRLYKKLHNRNTVGKNRG